MGDELVAAACGARVREGTRQALARSVVSLAVQQEHIYTHAAHKGDNLVAESLGRHVDDRILGAASRAERGGEVPQGIALLGEWHANVRWQHAVPARVAEQLALQPLRLRVSRHEERQAQASISVFVRREQKRWLRAGQVAKARDKAARGAPACRASARRTAAP